jgi:hypothetical protein
MFHIVEKPELWILQSGKVIRYRGTVIATEQLAALWKT